MENYIQNYDFSQKNPFAVIPWDQDFLERLEPFLEALNEKHLFDFHKENISSNKQEIILVFPHGRPRRYLESRYKAMSKKAKKAHILPHIMTGQDFLFECLSHFEREKKPYTELSSLDRISLLHDAVIKVTENLPESSVLKRLLEGSDKNAPKNTQKNTSAAKFFPWAKSLDNLFEECFSQLVDVVDISNAEGEVSPFAAALLSELRAIHLNYIDLLQIQDTDSEKNLLSSKNLYRSSTPAFSACRAAQFIQAYDRYQLCKEKNIAFSQINENRIDSTGLFKNTSDEFLEDFFSNFIPDIFKDKIIIFAGFVRLTEAENILYKFFWERGASIVLHSDPALCQVFDNTRHTNNKVHYSCVDHEEWIHRWKSSAQLLVQASNSKPIIHFYSAYDSHSQLQALKQDLVLCMQNLRDLPSHNMHEEATESVTQEIAAESVTQEIADDALALLLPKPSLLMPVLHELPEKDINISMGYPISRTLFGQFLELIMGLQENRIEKECHRTNLEKDLEESKISYTWRNLIGLFRHPYARMLMPQDAKKYENDTQNTLQEKDRNDWLSLLYYLEKSLRKGTYEQNIHEFLDDVLGDIDNQKFAKDFNFSTDLDAFLSNFLHHSISAWEKVSCLEDIAENLENYLDFLLAHGSALWQRFPLDAESLVRCVEQIIPSLRENGLSKEFLPQNALFTILRQLIAEQRIPFEADPLTGMQILGMLESRLLRFKNVFLLDMTEENLPGLNQQDPLMPDALRNLLSLPNSHKREILMAHTFYRLIAGAENVWLYWQEGVQSSQIQSSKSLRSRFVEECLWEEEQKRSKILQNGEDILRAADCRPIAPQRKKKQDILVTEEIQNALIHFFSKPLSASALNSYIHCPAQFFYTYIAHIGEAEEVSEGDDYKEFGNWFHALMCDIYKDYKGEIFEHNEENLQKALDLFHKRLDMPIDLETDTSKNITKFTSAESVFMIKCSGEFHLRNYWQSMPPFIKLHALEEEFESDLPHELFSKNTLGISRIRLKGRFDRVDIRVNLLDYQGYSLPELLNDESDNIAIQEHWILDYKTGKKQSVSDKVWAKTELWEALEKVNSEENAQNEESTLKEKDEILLSLSENFSNIQLPFYLYLYSLKNPQLACNGTNAAWVFLTSKDTELPLTKIISQTELAAIAAAEEERAKKKKKVAEEDSPEYDDDYEGDSEKLQSWELLEQIKTKRMPALLQFTINHMLQTKNFKACESKNCIYCPHRMYC